MVVAFATGNPAAGDGDQRHPGRGGNRIADVLRTSPVHRVGRRQRASGGTSPGRRAGDDPKPPHAYGLGALGTFWYPAPKDWRTWRAWIFSNSQLRHLPG